MKIRLAKKILKGMDKLSPYWLHQSVIYIAGNGNNGDHRITKAISLTGKRCRYRHHIDNSTLLYKKN